MDKTIYKTRLRNKGQVTVPQEIRKLLGVEEDDDLLFYTDEAGRVVVSRAQIIDPDGVTTEYVRCTDPTASGIVIKIIRTALPDS